MLCFTVVFLHRRHKANTYNSRPLQRSRHNDLCRQHRDPNRKWAHRLLQVRCASTLNGSSKLKLLSLLMGVRLKLSLCFYLSVSRVNSSPSSEASSPFGPAQEKLVSPQTSRSVSDTDYSTFTWSHMTVLDKRVIILLWKRLALAVNCCYSQCLSMYSLILKQKHITCCFF